MSKHVAVDFTPEARNWYTAKMVTAMQKFLSEQLDNGLSGWIKVQLTDVETECNGLMTYDREVLKVDPEAIRRAAVYTH